MQRKRVSVGELLRDYVSAAENVTEWGRSKKADIARLQASRPPSSRSSLERSISKEKPLARAHPGA